MTDSAPVRKAASQPELKRELLWNLGLLMVAALSLAIAAALIAQALEPRLALAVLIFLIGADIVVLFLFGRYLIDRLVLRPMNRLTQAADQLASGNVSHRAPAAETREFSDLAERFNHMTDRLLDTQSKLFQAEKLGSLGRIAAGVAHEVGNPLSAIGTYVEVLARRGGDPKVLEAITRETERIDRLVRSLLTYARPQQEAVGTVSVGSVIQSAVELLSHQGALKGVELDVQCDPDLPLVAGKEHLLEQVIVNLLLNAAHAAARGRVAAGVAKWRFHERGDSDPRRTDAPDRQPPERKSAKRPWRPDIPEGTLGVLLWVADSGPGVPEAERARVFEPFFTTKPPGHGTGLGLAIVQRIVYELGGVVWVDDAREGGAAFKVFLPEAE